MKIIITENQSESLKEKLQTIVKKYGWERGVMSVGKKNLLKLGFNNNPTEFLNLFNDLDVVQSKEDRNSTLLKNDLDEVILYCNEKYDYIWVSHDKIWLVLKDSFDLDRKQISHIVPRWLHSQYNLAAKPDWFSVDPVKQRGLNQFK